MLLAARLSSVLAVRLNRRRRNDIRLREVVGASGHNAELTDAQSRACVPPPSFSKQLTCRREPADNPTRPGAEMTDPDKWWLPYPPAYGLNSWQLDGRNCADNPGFSLVVGSPWSGKTTLVRSMAELLADDGGWKVTARSVWRCGTITPRASMIRRWMLVGCAAELKVRQHSHSR